MTTLTGPGRERCDTGALRCQACGEHHANGGEALACDHRREDERWHDLVGGLHATNSARGCPLCASEGENQ